MPEYLSLKGFAEHAEMKISTLSAYRSRGQQHIPEPDMVIDGHNFWAVSTVNEWIKNRRES